MNSFCSLINNFADKNPQVVAGGEGQDGVAAAHGPCERAGHTSQRASPVGANIQGHHWTTLLTTRVQGRFTLVFLLLLSGNLMFQHNNIIKEYSVLHLMASPLSHAGMVRRISTTLQPGTIVNANDRKKGFPLIFRATVVGSPKSWLLEHSTDLLAYPCSLSGLLPTGGSSG